MGKKRNFFHNAQTVIEKWKEGRSPSTNDNYLTALRSLKKFTKERNIDLDELSEALVKAYEYWLRENGVGLNTISCYMRSLRSLHRQLGDKGDPFGKAFTGSTKTEKRSITLDDLRRLRQLDLRHDPPLQFARDLFLFSVYALGMPFVDLAHLKKHNLRGGSIVYMRRKTHQTIRIPMEPCMLDIIKKYEQADNDYVFPIIHSSHMRKTPYEQYRRALHTYNRQLKLLADTAGIEARLTSYVVRHTWASIAYEKNVEICVISKALGHTNPQTTQIYIREINDERLATANRTLLASFLE